MNFKQELPIDVRSEAEAWKKANELFPCDYMLDDGASLRAGYNVYQGTDGKSWIRDLGCRLELNIVTEDETETRNIWITNQQKYTIEQVRGMILNLRKELEAADEILKLINSMDECEITKDIRSTLDFKKEEIQDKLHQFGI